MKMRMRMQNGFTMVELVVALSISSIVVALGVMFLTAPIQTSIAQNRRGALDYGANSLSNLLGEDVRQALPNSLRVQRNGAIMAMEMLRVIDSARYRRTTPMGNSPQELDISAMDAEFNVLGQFRNLLATPTAIPYVVINHLGTPGADAYALADVIAANGTITRLGNEDHITLLPAFKFAADSATQRVFLVSGPVSYLCDEAAGTLRRYSGYAIAANQSNRNTANKLLAAGATEALVAQGIVNCQAWLRIGQTQQHDLLQVLVQFADSGEQLRLFKQFAVEQLP